MTVHQRGETTPGSTNGGEQSWLVEKLEDLARQFGNRFLLEPAPDERLPEHGMPAGDAMRLVFEELVLDGIPQRNLATFVTTWMEPEAQRVIAGNLHRPTTSRPCARSSSSRSGTAWRTRSPPTSRRRARRLSKGGLHELDRKRVKTGTGY